MNDKFRDDQPSKPKAGVITVHDKKGNASTPNSGVTLHPEKAKYDEAHGRSGLSTPSSGGTLHKEKADGKNRVEQLSDPKGGDAPIPTERLHLDKVKAHAAGIHEPKAKGKYLTGESTTKVK